MIYNTSNEQNESEYFVQYFSNTYNLINWNTGLVRQNEFTSDN